MTQTTSLLRTPFHEFHVEHGARMVDFAGWEMPMLYRSIVEEHRQVRSSGGLFDVSHMGRLRIRGPSACRFLDYVCTRRIEGMADGQCRYSLVCNATGGCRDDVLVYRLAEDEYVMVVNASNRDKIIRHFKVASAGYDVDVTDETLDTAMLAIQGPRVIELIAVLSPEAPSIRRYRFITKDVMGAPLLISRTGYTGEDGVEVILPAALAPLALSLIASTLDAGAGAVMPAGLGARDTLRLEAAMPLYGHEITEELDPLSAGLDFAVGLDKGDDDSETGGFIGQEALRNIAASGPRRRLAGLILQGRRTARQGMAVKRNGRQVGAVTSACLSPTLDKPIAMAYLDAPHAKEGARVEVELANAPVGAQVVKLPFYRKAES